MLDVRLVDDCSACYVGSAVFICMACPVTAACWGALRDNTATHASRFMSVARRVFLLETTAGRLARVQDRHQNVGFGLKSL